MCRGLNTGRKGNSTEINKDENENRGRGLSKKDSSPFLLE
jgi:hypothetical protein